MDPKELAKLYEKKSAATAANVTEKKVRMEAQQAEFRKRIELGRVAMRDVVIPYFKGLVSTFPKGAFKFIPTPNAVSFQIGNGAEHFIEVNQGNVRIWKRGNIPPQAGSTAKGRKGASKSPGINIALVYPGTAEPFIAGPSDLTREKLGKFVEMAIKES